MYCRSSSTMRRALGPGSEPVRRGSFVSVMCLSTRRGNAPLYTRGALSIPARKTKNRMSQPGACGTGGDLKLRARLLAFPADGPAARVFQHHTALGKLLADAVRGGKIAALARSLTRGNQLRNLEVTQRVRGNGHAERLQSFVIVIL